MLEGSEPEGSEPSVSDPAGVPPRSVRPYRETCADNPLLAECPQTYDFCRENPQGSGCSPAPAAEPATEEPADEEPLAIAAARYVLLSHCGACHGPALTAAQASASINYIDDWSQLLEAGLLERCSPERSRIVVVMRAGNMPPIKSGRPAVLDADIEIVADAIDLHCSD